MRSCNRNSYRGDLQICSQDFKKRVADIQEMLNDVFLKDIFCEQQQVLKKRYPNDDLYNRVQAAAPKVLPLKAG
eukprot:2428659-Amphidinium_carterae.1